jgi:hypothetical protein
MSSELARKVGMLPATYETSNKSTAMLLRDVGHPDALRDLSEAQVEQVLRADPKLIDLWFKRGADQRLSGGWGVDGADGEYRVQNFANGECLQFHDHAEACAAFIVRYVACIADANNRFSN